LDLGKAAEGDGLGVGTEDEDEDEVEPSVAGASAMAEFFGTGWKKKTKDNTPANAVRAIKTMATAPSRLFIFCLTT
jgi:hypothetical protein